MKPTTPAKPGNYVSVRTGPASRALYGARTKSARVAIRDAGWSSAPIEHWDGEEWTDTGTVLHAAPRPVGRPPGDPLLRASAQILIRCTDAQKSAIVEAAKRGGSHVSEWIRDVALRAASRGGGGTGEG